MEEYLKFGQEIADGAAIIALKYFGFDTAKTWKSDNTPLTQADTEINRFVIEKIQAAFPEHSIAGEEESSKKENSKYIWVCDPIDGTMPYSCGLPTFTFSLALVDQSDGQPIVGIVNDPIMKNMYWAYKGGGAYRNGQKISVTADKSVKNTYVSVEGPTIPELSNPKVIEEIQKGGAKAMVFLSFVYGATQVANGKFTGSVFSGCYAHDVAAIKIITEEAGGKVTDLNGKDRRYDEDGFGCIVSNGILHDEMLQAVTQSKQ